MDSGEQRVTGSGLHVLLPTVGSAGDVHPMIALGMTLQRRGHRATVITNEVFADTVRSAGLEFISLGTAAEAQAAIADPRLWHPVNGFQCIAERVLIPALPPALRHHRRPCRLPRGGGGGRHLSRRTGGSGKTRRLPGDHPSSAGDVSQFDRFRPARPFHDGSPRSAFRQEISVPAH